MTTYPTSTAPTVKAWLYAQMVSTLTAATDGTFQLSYASNVTSPNSPDDMVWLGKVTNRVVSNFAMVGNLGQYALSEEYDVEVNISCYRAGEENDTNSALDPAGIAEARAWVLAGAVETIARTDPTLGGNVVTSRPDQSECDVDWDDAGNGRIATLTLTIHCFATI
jgi:hypothetical protein